MKRGKKKSKLFIVLTVISIVILAVGMILAGMLLGAYHRDIILPDVVQEKIDLLPDLNAKEGTAVPNESNPVDLGEFRIIINQMLTMDNGESPCNIQVENSAENHYDLRVCLYLKDTGDLLGATHRIGRGKRVEEIDLSQVLPAGNYDVVAVFELFDDDLEKVNEMSVNLNLLIKNDIA